jgi:hypothetical protein
MQVVDGYVLMERQDGTMGRMVEDGICPIQHGSDLMEISGFIQEEMLG